MRSYIHTYIHTYLHTYIHTYIHTHIHIRMHIHIWSLTTLARVQTPDGGPGCVFLVNAIGICYDNCGTDSKQFERDPHFLILSEVAKLQHLHRLQRRRRA